MKIEDRALTTAKINIGGKTYTLEALEQATKAFERAYKFIGNLPATTESMAIHQEMTDIIDKGEK